MELIIIITCIVGTIIYNTYLTFKTNKFINEVRDMRTKNDIEMFFTYIEKGIKNEGILEDYIDDFIEWRNKITK